MALHEGDIAWVTGGSSGIGEAIARELVGSGYRVAISGRSEAKLQSAASSMGALAIVCDVRDEASVAKAHQSIVEALGPVSLLVNNAGITLFERFGDITVEQFDDVISTNLTGLFYCTRTVLPDMYTARRGVIVQMLSVASTKAFAEGAAYGASKFGALGFTNSLREEARKHNVKVIALMPGATETEAWDTASREEFHERMMQPVDIAQTLTHILSQPDRMMTEEIVLRPILGDL